VESLALNCPVLVIHVWAEWNGYDPLMDTTLVTLRQRFESQVEFRSINFDLHEAWPLFEKWNVLNLPALVCYLNGIYRGTVIGVRDVSGLEARFQSWLSSR
jgi:hypothetical protein